MQAVIYAAVLAAFLFLFHVGDYGEPYGLAFLFACLSADLSFFLCGLFYLLSAAITGEWLLLFLYLGSSCLDAENALFSEIGAIINVLIADDLALSLFDIRINVYGYEKRY